MSGQYYLRCLGQPALFNPYGVLVPFRTRKHLALLVYLLVEERSTHRRDRLAEFLWPRAALTEARHSLATALSVLRPRLPPGTLEATRDQVRIRTGGILLDVKMFGSPRTDEYGTPQVAEIAGFLEGFEIPDSPEFSLWRDRQQARFLPQVKAALVLSIEQMRQTGKSGLIERLADRMLVLDELSEEGIRAKIEARAWAGDRLGALKIYEDWKRKLNEDLRAKPSEQLETMTSSLRRGGWERAAVGDIPGIPLNQGRERVFVGRAEEYRKLHGTWEGLKQGKARHSMILGDSGVGKTTLVERFSTAVCLDGAAVARVQAYDLDHRIPFATLGGLGLSLLDMSGVSTTPPEALAEVARAIPEIRRRFPHLPQPAVSQGETARIRLTEAFQQLLIAVAEERPLLIIVDDLHLADEASLAVLQLVLRRSTSAPILAVFLGRPAEFGRSSQASLLRENLSRLGSQEINLAPLTHAECSELLGALLTPHAQQPTATVRRTLIAASGGYPLALELLVQDWLRCGMHGVAIAFEGMTSDFVVGDELRAVLGQLVSRLADSLGPVTSSVMSLASVLGHRLNDLSMYSLIDLSLGQTMTGLGQLLEYRILRDSERGLEFTNELIRAHAYGAIPSPARRALHASVLDRLKAAEESNEELLGLELAWHTIRAGRTQEAIPHLIHGAKTAMRCGAPHSAERALASALGEVDRSSVTELTLLLAESLQEQGRWRESLDALNSIQDPPGAELAQEVFALSAFARSYLGLAGTQELLHVLPMLEETVRSCRHVATRVRAARAIAHGLVLLRDRDLAQRLLPLLNDIPVDALDIDSRGQLALSRALFLFEAGELDASYREAEAGLIGLRAAGAANAVAVHLQSGLGFNRSLQGRYDEAVPSVEAALKMAIRLGNDVLVAGILANLALISLRLGRNDQVLLYATQCEGLGQGEPANWADVTMAYSVAMVHAMEGRSRLSMEKISRLESRLPHDIPQAVLQRWLLWKADVLTVAGSHHDGMKTADRAVSGYHFELTSLGFAGAFARWVALITVGTSLEAIGRQVIAQLEGRLSDFDAMDQLEILCACSYARLRPSHEYADRIAAKSSELPAATVSLIRRLGMTHCK